MMIPISVEETLKKKTNQRFLRIVQRSKILNIDEPKFQDIIFLIEKSFNDGFLCCYCKRKLDLTTTRPYYSVFSIDHKIPLSRGGSNSIDNLAVCCNVCNIVKGTMTDVEFLSTFFKLPENTRVELFLNIYRGQLAKKIDRVCFENSSVDKKSEVKRE